MAAVTTGGARRRTQIARWTILGILAACFALPLFAMLNFSTKGNGSSRSLAAWRAIGSDSELLHAIAASLELAVVTALAMLVLLVPTLTWVHLRLPRLGRLVEFLCLLPLIIPAIVLVVGLAPLYAWVTYLFGDSSLTLAFVYVVLALPYAYRAIESGLTAIDLRTLAEAARSLGAPWRTVMLRIVVPNIRAAILSAVLLTLALVLGEFTLASLLNFQTMQVDMYLIGKRNAAVSIAVALASLIFAFALLFAFSLIAGRRSQAVVEEPLAAPLQPSSPDPTPRSASS